MGRDLTTFEKALLHAEELMAEDEEKRTRRSTIPFSERFDQRDSDAATIASGSELESASDADLLGVQRRVIGVLERSLESERAARAALVDGLRTALDCGHFHGANFDLGRLHKLVRDSSGSSETWLREKLEVAREEGRQEARVDDDSLSETEFK